MSVSNIYQGIMQYFLQETERIIANNKILMSNISGNMKNIITKIIAVFIFNFCIETPSNLVV